jgi:hypothetical protein
MKSIENVVPIFQLPQSVVSHNSLVSQQTKLQSSLNDMEFLADRAGMPINLLSQCHNP